MPRPGRAASCLWRPAAGWLGLVGIVEKDGVSQERVYEQFDLVIGEAMSVANLWQCQHVEQLLDG
jgi:hypothetical protein